MATAEIAGTLRSSEESVALASHLRRLSRIATVVALLTSPAVFFWHHHQLGLGLWWSLVAAAASVIAFRGVVDLATRRLIPWPSLFGTEEARLREEDVVNRRRAWTWRFAARFAVWVGGFITLVYVIQAAEGKSVTWWGTRGTILHGFFHRLAHPGSYLPLVAIFFVYFVFNFL